MTKEMIDFAQQFCSPTQSVVRIEGRALILADSAHPGDVIEKHLDVALERKTTPPAPPENE